MLQPPVPAAGRWTKQTNSFLLAPYLNAPHGEVQTRSIVPGDRERFDYFRFFGIYGLNSAY
jgi:hypothetical protein